MRIKSEETTVAPLEWNSTEELDSRVVNELEFDSDSELPSDADVDTESDEETATFSRINSKPSPPKRRRLLFDCVLIPSAEERATRMAASLIEEEAWYKLKKDEHPRLKIKKDAVAPVLPSEVVKILDSIPRYELTAAQRLESDIDVSRNFITNAFGGNTRSTFPSIRREKLAEHGLSDWMCVTKNHNPLAPTVPGNPGLFFCGDMFGLPNVDSAPSQNAVFPHWATTERRVLTRLSPSHWLYVGQYKLAFHRALTPAEWASQSQTVKNTWVTKTTTKKWALPVRARLLLRDRLGRRPTKTEVAKKLQRAHETKDKLEVSSDRITAAYRDGEEYMLLWKMECVGYDTAFQHRLATEFVRPPPKPKTASKSKAKRKTASKKKETASNLSRTRTGPSKKRKRADHDDDSDSESEYEQ